MLRELCPFPEAEGDWDETEQADWLESIEGMRFMEKRRREEAADAKAAEEAMRANGASYDQILAKTSYQKCNVQFDTLGRRNTAYTLLDE